MTVKDRKKIDGVEIFAATSSEQIKKNIAAACGGYRNFHDHPDWRENMPVAVVGGGPSLHARLDALRKFHNILAAGSVHDFLVENGIRPRWCVVCDGDPIMANYLRNPVKGCSYLIASQCDPAVFEELKGYDVFVWHAADHTQDVDIFGEKQVLIGGGCTVGMRSITIARIMGYRNIHLFGFDTCLEIAEGDVGTEVKHHAYAFTDKSEKIGAIQPVTLGESEKIFYLANYHIGQLFDFRELVGKFGHDMTFTIHGGGVLAELGREGRRIAA